MSQHDFGGYCVPRVDVTLLRDGLCTIRGMIQATLSTEGATLTDLKTALLELEEVAKATLWKLEEATDAGYCPPPIGGLNPPFA